MPTLWVRKEDYTPHESWRLIEWCRERGGNAFALTFLQPPDPPLGAWEAVDAMLAPFVRAELLHQYALTSDTIEVLRSLFPDGLFTYTAGLLSLEDPTVYRDTVEILAITSHGGEGVVELNGEDYSRFIATGLPHRTTSRWA